VSDWDNRVTAALAGGVLLGAIVAAVAGPLARLAGGRGLRFDCAPDDSFCICWDMLDCINMGDSKKCNGKETICGLGVCVCL